MRIKKIEWETVERINANGEQFIDMIFAHLPTGRLATIKRINPNAYSWNICCGGPSGVEETAELAMEAARGAWEKMVMEALETDTGVSDNIIFGRMFLSSSWAKAEIVRAEKPIGNMCDLCGSSGVNIGDIYLSQREFKRPKNNWDAVDVYEHFLCASCTAFVVHASRIVAKINPLEAANDL